jgi:hypothetical protein
MNNNLQVTLRNNQPMPTVSQRISLFVSLSNVERPCLWINISSFGIIGGSDYWSYKCLVIDAEQQYDPIVFDEDICYFLSDLDPLRTFRSFKHQPQWILRYEAKCKKQTDILATISQYTHAKSQPVYWRLVNARCFTTNNHSFMSLSSNPAFG